MSGDIKAQYAARVAAGEIERDCAQETVLAMLDTAGQAWTLLELKKRELSQERATSR